VPPDVWLKLKAYHWPGNVRELRNVIERCVLLSDSAVFPAQWLQLPGQPIKIAKDPAQAFTQIEAEG
jgi:transcriptional regulator with PAS, ATPase and Fis domain